MNHTLEYKKFKIPFNDLKKNLTISVIGLATLVTKSTTAGNLTGYDFLDLTKTTEYVIKKIK